MDNYQGLPTNFDLQGALLAQRATIVRWCAHWTRSVDIAEDLAQETLIEAWRNADKLCNEAVYEAWLRGIARNVCRRWSQRRSREQNYLSLPHLDEHFVVPGLTNSFADDCDLEVELERDELATLLDRALTLLPPDTRAILIQKYVEDSPHAEIAARLGLSEGAVAMRLQRGKLAFQRILSTKLREEAAAYGLVGPTTDEWQQTRIWCPICGQHRLKGKFSHHTHQLILRCPVCTNAPDTAVINMEGATVLKGVRGFKAALNRVVNWVAQTLRHEIATQQLTCVSCGHLVPLQPRLNDHHALPLRYGFQATCPVCHDASYALLYGFIFCLPEVQRFWRHHPRVRMVPEHEVQVAGSPGIITRFESVGQPANIDILVARDTFEVLEIHEHPH